LCAASAAPAPALDLHSGPLGGPSGWGVTVWLTAGVGGLAASE